MIDTSDTVTTLLESGREFDVDPRLIVGISGQETGFGKHLCGEYNAWNWFWCASTGDCGGSDPVSVRCGLSPFSNWSAGIETVTRGIRRGYLNKGYTTISLIGAKYCGEGCEHWVPNVTTFHVNEMRGDAADLRHPCVDTTPVTLATFNAGGWSGNYYVYNWLVLVPNVSGKLASVTSELFMCANGSCGGPAYYVICAVDGGYYGGCPADALLATSDPTYGIGIPPPYGAGMVRQEFKFSGASAITLLRGQRYFVRPYICSFGSGHCAGGQALGGGLQTFVGVPQSSPLQYFGHIEGTGLDTVLVPDTYPRDPGTGAPYTCGTYPSTARASCNSSYDWGLRETWPQAMGLGGATVNGTYYENIFSSLGGRAYDTSKVIGFYEWTLSGCPNACAWSTPPAPPP